MKEKVRLICTTGGSNKYYEMEQTSDSLFEVKFGRIDAIGFQTSHYLISQWDKKYKEKIKKGYIDVSKTITKFSLDDIFANLDLLEERLKSEVS